MGLQGVSMIAKLPKIASVLSLTLLAFAILFLFGALASGENVQTASSTLEGVLNRVMGNTLLPPDQQLMLVAAITGAVDAGTITPDEVDTLLDTASWGSIADTAQAEFAAQALDSVLNLMIDEQVGFDKAKSYLEKAITSGNLDEIPSPQSDRSQFGIQTAISHTANRFSYDREAIQDVQTKVNELIENGVPAGTVLRTVDQLIRAGAAPEEIIAALDTLAASIAQGTPPGKAANEATNTGNPQTKGKKLNPSGNTNNGGNHQPTPPKKEKEHQHSKSAAGQSGESNGKK